MPDCGPVVGRSVRVMDAPMRGLRGSACPSGCCADRARNTRLERVCTPKAASPEPRKHFSRAAEHGTLTSSASACRKQLRPHTHLPASLLTPDDAAALAAFASAVGPLAWQHSGLGHAPQPIAGCWEQGRLVAAAGYTVWGGTLAHIGVTTQPVSRGSGYGRSVVSAIGRHALERGYVLSIGRYA